MIVSSDLLLLKSVWVQYQCVLMLVELLWICRTTCAKKRACRKILWSFSTSLFISLTAQEHTHPELIFCCAPPSINVSLHVILRAQACSVHPSGWGRGGALQHVSKDLNEVVQTPQVTVLPVSLGPGCAVVQGLGCWQWDGFTKVNHPYSGQAWSIVHE